MKYFHLEFILFVITVSLQLRAFDSSPPIKIQPDFQEISNIVKKSFQQSPVKGLAVGVVTKDSIVYSETLGREPNTELSETTPLWMGSVSKTYTALAICRLKELGKLDFNDIAGSFLDGSYPDNLNQITVRDLLHHHSGISQKSGYAEGLEFENDLNTLEFLEEPGRMGMYSSANYLLLGKVIEAVSNMEYAEFMEKEIFQPLGLDQTYVPNHEDYSKFLGYTIYYGIPILSRQMQYGKAIAPAGYIVSTLDDINKYAQFLLGDGTVTKNGNEELFLSKEIFTALFETYGGSKSGFAKSWGVSFQNNMMIYGHEGLTKISNAKMTLIPEKGIAISVISNTNSGPFYSISSQFSKKLVSTMFGTEDESNIVWEYVIRILIGLILLKSILSFFIATRKWLKIGKPMKLRLKKSKLWSYLQGLLPLVVVICLPSIINLSYSMLFRVMPDFAFALIAGGFLALGQLFFKLTFEQSI